MTAACATGQRHATWPSFARSLSTWSPETGARKPAYGAGARRLLGTTATCSRSSHPKLMREPWGGGAFSGRFGAQAQADEAGVIGFCLAIAIARHRFELGPL